MAADKPKEESAQARVLAYRRFNILALDGGIVRGAVEAVLLERLDREFLKLLRNTDLLVGTSMGGVLALVLAAGFEPSYLREAYENIAQHVLADSSTDKQGRAAYSNEALRELLEIQFGDKKLKDLDKKVAIPAFNLDVGAQRKFRSWGLKVFHNFESNNSSGDELCVDVGLRTSATPVYFPTVDGYCGGGVVANNPSMVGLAQALDMRLSTKVPLAQVNLLSIGAGTSARWVEGDDLDWDSSQWAPHLLPMLLEGSMSMVDFQCQQILGKNYYRVNPILSDQVSLDDWGRAPEMVTQANEMNLESASRWLKEHWK
jgi:patatin-like phospholipase/acyl hydrolase